MKTLLPLTSHQLSSTWTFTDGRQVEASYVSSTATHVTIERRDGGQGTVALDNLSAADRDYVQQRQQAEPSVPAHHN